MVSSDAAVPPGSVPPHLSFYADENGGSAAKPSGSTNAGAGQAEASSVNHFRCWRPLDDELGGSPGEPAMEGGSMMGGALGEWVRQVPPGSLGPW